jgi:procollagen-lysine,2-oxoglutarate 5-dioxygenase
MFFLFFPIFRSYDVIFLAPWDTIVDKFKESKARVLFGAENFCWPDDELKSKYPPPEGEGQKYLNSGMFIGYAANLYNILNWKPVKDTEDDQLFYTKVYLDEKMRVDNKIKLDHKSNVFQNLNGNVGKVEELLCLELIN